MHPLPSFHLQLAAVHISHAAVAGAPRGFGNLQSVHILPTAGFHISQSGGLNPPGGTYTCRKTVQDGQRRVSRRGGGKTVQHRPSHKNSWMGFGETERGGGSAAGGSGVLSSKRADGPQLPPRMHRRNLVIASSCWRSCPSLINASPYVAACIRARWWIRVWLRYVILCGPQLLCHTAVHDGKCTAGSAAAPPVSLVMFLPFPPIDRAHYGWLRRLQGRCVTRDSAPLADTSKRV